MIPPLRSIPLDYEVDPEPSDTSSELGRSLPPTRSGDWPAFADDDAGRGSFLGPAVVLILAVIASALIGLIFLGWRVGP